MFQWLVKMLIDTPVASSGCPCCEAKRNKLEKMRRAVAGEDDTNTMAEEKTVDLSFNNCKCQDYLVKKYGVYFQNGYGLPAGDDKKEE